MTQPIILASGSSIRATLLRNAGLSFEVAVPKVDEDSLKASLLAEAATPRDIADALAEMKCQKIAAKTPGHLVIGCDQVLDLNGTLLSKPKTTEDAHHQLRALMGQTHKLLSAIVVYDDARPVWRHVGVAKLTMHEMSEAWLADYIDRNWDSIRHSVGSYKLEEEGVRLFSRIEGDYFTILGLPLLELLSYLTRRGTLPS